MTEFKHTIQDLKMRQALPLEIKIRMTKQRIREWVDYYGKDGVYISFSGGKDSTVLLNLVREDYPDIPAVFVDTGLEYPEIRDFVKTIENVTWLKPRMNFKQVIKKYGYPMISKEVSESVYFARKYLDELATNTEKRSQYVGYLSRADILGLDRKDEESIRALKEGDFIDLDKHYKELEENHETNFRLKVMFEKLEHKAKGKLTGEYSNRYDRSKYKFLLLAPFLVGNGCCRVMKKSPVKKYGKESGKVAMTGQMADESQLRTQKWLQYGCNAFDCKNPISNPLSFWTEQDILKYIKENSIKICNIYGDIVPDYEAQGNIVNQVDFSDLGLCEDNKPLKTTGCKRTGCMFCGFGCHLEKKEDSRFLKMKETHPQIYDYIMRPESEGGLNYREVLSWINENGNLDIKF